MRSLKWKWGVGGAKDIALPPPFAEIVVEPDGDQFVDTGTSLFLTGLGNASPGGPRYTWQFHDGSGWIAATNANLVSIYPLWAGTSFNNIDNVLPDAEITAMHPSMDAMRLRLRVRNEPTTADVSGTEFRVYVSDYAEAGYVDPGYVE